MRSVIAYTLLAAVAVGYFTPAMIALRRMKQEAAKIFLVNLLLGWTITGWLAVLSWSTASGDTDLRTAENAARWRAAIRHSRRARESRC
jgi:hypothetical protein